MVLDLVLFISFFVCVCHVLISRLKSGLQTQCPWPPLRGQWYFVFYTCLCAWRFTLFRYVRYLELGLYLSEETSGVFLCVCSRPFSVEHVIVFRGSLSQFGRRYVHQNMSTFQVTLVGVGVGALCHRQLIAKKFKSPLKYM